MFYDFLVYFSLFINHGYNSVNTSRYIFSILSRSGRVIHQPPFSLRFWGGFIKKVISSSVAFVNGSMLAACSMSWSPIASLCCFCESYTTPRHLLHRARARGTGCPVMINVLVRIMIFSMFSCIVVQEREKNKTISAILLDSYRSG